MALPALLALAHAKKILIVAHTPRHWEALLKSRLEAAGYVVGGQHDDAGPTDSVDQLLMIEGWRRIPPLAGRSATRIAPLQDAPDLVIDLTSSLADLDVPVLTLEFGGRSTLGPAVAEVFLGTRQVTLTVRLDGVAVGVASPMLDDRLWLSRVTDSVLAGAISLLVQAVDRCFADRLDRSTSEAAPPIPRRPLVLLYLATLASGLVTRLWAKLTRQRPFYWQVAYRTIDGPGIAETGRLDGTAFTVLPDDGQRFYADPFVIERSGKHYLFVEEYPYSTGRGVISVAELSEEGTFGTPRIVLEEPHHLSYPQIFAHEGEMFMLPESGGAGELVLYRSVEFPNRWVRDTMLLAGRDVNDATLLIRDGRYWLFASERLGQGSASDTLAVFSAPSLRGPWEPHCDNPIAIDLTAARPGGAFFVPDGDEPVLPVQDGRGGYGNGLGLMRLRRLGDDGVQFERPRPVRAGTAWPRRGIHTLNRAGRVEVVDSAAELRM
jgi:hypothetical protein